MVDSIDMRIAEDRLICDRCHQKIDGRWDSEFSSGFYIIHEYSPWKKYGRPGEEVLCDNCMFEDPQYCRDFNRPLRGLYGYSG